MSLEETEGIMWHVGTVAMILNLILCITFGIITKLGSQHHQQIINKRASQSARSIKKDKQEFMSYFIYSFAALCAIQCFLCHYSMLWYKDNADGYCRWGAPVCVVLFFSAKACLYGFFLERSKLAQGLLTIFPDWLFKYTLPIYIFIYWLIWTIFIMVFFEGAPNQTVTSCVMETYLPWILTLGAFIDVFNTFLFLFLFIYPLRKAYNATKAAFDNNSSKRNKFISMMWFNIMLSTVCTISSFIYLFVLPVIFGYLWFAGQIDMMINSICVFLMLASNRKYVTIQCNKYCDCLCCECCGDDKIINNKIKYKPVDSKTNGTKSIDDGVNADIETNNKSQTESSDYELLYISEPMKLKDITDSMDPEETDNNAQHDFNDFIKSEEGDGNIVLRLDKTMDDDIMKNIVGTKTDMIQYLNDVKEYNQFDSNHQ